ncbi:MAG: hypothetical protein J5701_04740 [Bacteroidales bacterium]|nr:hypothetical protein [Bacteroidales bacterium]
MKIENVSLPYPVLGISDDIRPTLEETGCANPEIIIKEDETNFDVLVVLQLKNEGVLNYIQEDFAEFSVEVSCHSTMYRKCVTSAKPEFNFIVEKNLLNGKLEFECFVIAKKDIHDYKNDGLNPDYDGHIINLHKGDLLVAYRKCSIPLNLDLRNVRNLKSFMTVQKNNRTNENSVTYDLDSPKIQILLPEEMMNEYNKKSSSSIEKEKRKIILKSSLYVQALTYALLNYSKYKDKDYMWVNALNYRMNEPDIRDICSDIINDEPNNHESQNIDDSFKLAHMMLNQPYLGMLKYISADENHVGNILTED